MKDFINIGSSPCNEDCAQVGSENYSERAIEECYRFIHAIKATIGQPPENASLVVKGFDHDFGRYYEVVCYFNPSDEASQEYAFRCESEAPGEWPEGYRTKAEFIELLNQNSTPFAA